MEIFSENIDDLLPVLAPMKKRIEEIKSYTSEIERKAESANDSAIKVESAVNDMSKEFEYMKARFSPSFLQRVDKALLTI